MMQADDNVAEAFVRIGELKLAVQHCVASIEVPIRNNYGFIINHNISDAIRCTDLKINLCCFCHFTSHTAEA